MKMEEQTEHLASEVATLRASFQKLVTKMNVWSKTTNFTKINVVLDVELVISDSTMFIIIMA